MSKRDRAAVGGII